MSETCLPTQTLQEESGWSSALCWDSEKCNKLDTTGNYVELCVYINIWMYIDINICITIYPHIIWNWHSTWLPNTSLREIPPPEQGKDSRTESRWTRCKSSNSIVDLYCLKCAKTILPSSPNRHITTKKCISAGLLHVAKAGSARKPRCFV